MRPVSPAKRKAKQEYANAGKIILMRHPHCWLSHVLYGQVRQAMEIHHTKGRIGDLIHDQRFLLQIHPIAHRWLEDHLRAARAMGVLFDKGYGIHDEENAEQLKKWRHKVTFPLMSFAMTTEALVNKTKSVTRRTGWENAKAGDIVVGCHKTMGFAKGECPRRLAIIQIKSVNRERLIDIHRYPGETAREGFPDLTADQFIEMLAKHYGANETIPVTRLEFEHLGNINEE